MALVRTKGISSQLLRRLPAVFSQSRRDATLLRLADLEAEELSVDIAQRLKPKVPNEQLVFGKTTTDHMLEIDWDNTTGWHAPHIRPYSTLKLDPSASSLHYALQLFEGMKAYRDVNTGSIRMFRPGMNYVRMNRSAEAMFFPTFSNEEFHEILKEYLILEKDWIPKGEGYSLYLRPTMISTHPFLGVGPAHSVKLFVIAGPVGPYYPSGFAPIKLFADTEHVRAWPGGVGCHKLGGNYGPTIRPQMEAAAAGYAQVLWLNHDILKDDYKVTEVGTMNQFFLWIREDGKKELITAPLDDGTILPGVTRDTVLHFAREWGEFEVSERPYYISEVIKAIEDGRMLEAFGTGTAAVVSPVDGFHFKGKDYTIPLDLDDPSAKAGPLAQRMWDTITGIQYGKIDHEFGLSID